MIFKVISRHLLQKSHLKTGSTRIISCKSLGKRFQPFWQKNVSAENELDSTPLEH